MDWREYIHSDSNIAVGKPVVKGTRLAVEFLLDFYGAGWTERFMPTRQKAFNLSSEPESAFYKVRPKQSVCCRMARV